MRYVSLWINKDLTSRSKNGTANATGDYASAIGNNYVNISGFTVEYATSNLGWSVGKENNSQKGITLNTKCSYNKLDSRQWKQRLPQQHGQYLSTQQVHIRAYPSPKPPLSGIKNEKFTGRDFALREKITSAMSKSEKSTRCCPASMRVAASSHTSVKTVEPQKQSISDATVASVRIVARITQTDKWAKSLGNALFDVPHRHAVLTIPAALWLIVRRNRFLHKVLMDAAIAAINDTISYKHRTHRRAEINSYSPAGENPA